MVEGYCYAAPNEFILEKLIKYVRKKHINYSLFDYYIVTENEIDFRDFRFKISKYYLQRIGNKSNGYIEKIKLLKWLNNKYKVDTEIKKEIYKYCFKLKKSLGEYYLYVKNKRYKMCSNIHLISYFYKRKEPLFFEKDYNVLYADEHTFDVGEHPFELEHQEDILENPIKKTFTDYYDVEQTVDKEFHFETFYKYYFKKLTLNQQKVCALLLLGIKITDVARLLSTTQVYVTLEIKRLSKKIRKIYNKIGKVFWGENNDR